MYYTYFFFLASRAPLRLLLSQLIDIAGFNTLYPSLLIGLRKNIVRGDLVPAPTALRPTNA